MVPVRVHPAGRAIRHSYRRRKKRRLFFCALLCRGVEDAAPYRAVCFYIRVKALLSGRGRTCAARSFPANAHRPYAAR